jgi:hypothetical protein
MEELKNDGVGVSIKMFTCVERFRLYPGYHTLLAKADVCHAIAILSASVLAFMQEV